MKIKSYFSIAAALAIITATHNSAFSEVPELANMSLEELMKVTVSSVSKRDEQLKDASAAIYVITAQDIAHSNATSLPELLRQVPGLHVARIDGSNWAISSRGFNGLFNNKMLVMIDGRSVYTPLFGGVFWQIQDTMLEDIERIEVIRGSGSAVWGVNAVNGVINILTKNSNQTTGSLVTTSLSNEGEVLSARYGETLSDDSSFRVYGKGRNTEGFDTVGYNQGDARSEGFNGYATGQTGFRYDLNEKDFQSSIQGDWYAGNLQLSAREPLAIPPFFLDSSNTASISGGNIIAKNKWLYSTGDSLETSLIFDRTNREDQILKQGITTYEGSIQYSLASNNDHQLSFGSGYRFADLGLQPKAIVRSLDIDHSIQTVNAFLQDKYSFSDSLDFTAGLKFEHHEFIGAQWLPTLRSSWAATDSTTVWAAYSRAARVPSVSENQLAIDTGVLQVAPDTLLNSQLLPNKALDAEILNGFELGARIQPVNSVSFDNAVYFNQFDKLSTYDAIGTISVDPRITQYPFLPVLLENNGSANVIGLESVVTGNISKQLQVQGWYSLSVTNASFEGEGDSTSSDRNEDVTPVNQASLKAFYTFNDKWNFSTGVRYVDSVSLFEIPSYIAGSIRVGYKPISSLELSLGIENLFAPNHIEYQSDYISVPRSEIPTLGYLQAKVTF